MAQLYGIDGLAEARAYLGDPVLKGRLVEIAEALHELDAGDITAVLGSPDDLKLKSCMTLFHLADPDDPLFPAVLDRYYGGELDDQTIALTKST